MVSPTNLDTDLLHKNSVSVSRRRSLFLMTSLLFAFFVLLFYVLIPLWSNDQPLVLPLDDVYIHFQYAKQIANGEVYVYNPGLEPSSGATSLIYPYLLAIGYKVGFTDLSLGYWALLCGTLALFGSCWLIMLITTCAGGNPFISIVIAFVFALTGSVGWHFMSGMETGILIFFALLTFYAVLTRRFGLSIFAAMLMGMTRPEGSIMAIIAASSIFLEFRKSVSPRWWVWMLLPVLALGVQPLVNLIVTGNAEAAGSSAKSILSMIPADYSVIIPRILENFWRMWWEFLTGYSLREGLYLPVFLLILAAFGLFALGFYRHRWIVALMVMGWLMAGTAAVATLDPAFWHFKRYQMPFMALLFPLAGWGVAYLQMHSKIASWSVQIVMIVSAVVSSIIFFQPSYQLNVSYLHQQQLPMAAWLKANTAEDVVIAVHDVGLLRYLGERTTLDMVGLTTNGAADSWRNGPGALAEFMAAYEPRPQYVASYTDALGLSYLADTSIYGDLIEAFPVELSNQYNVALAGTYQGIWKIDWSPNEVAKLPHQPYFVDYATDMRLIDAINVANLVSELGHDYSWDNSDRLPGFPTEVYEWDYVACNVDCRILDGGRRINGFEQFKVNAESGQDMLLITRLHAAHSGYFDVYVDNVYVATRTIPYFPGQWLEVATLIPGEFITASAEIRIVPTTPDGHYMPYYHWIYQGEAPSVDLIDTSLVDFGQFQLVKTENSFLENQLTVDLTWQVENQMTEPGDYRLFLHLYNDLNMPPVAQADGYPKNGSLTPGNWLPGTLNDTIVLNLDNVAPDQYMIVVGFYDPTTGARLQPESDVYEVVADGRLLLGELEVK